MYLKRVVVIIAIFLTVFVTALGILVLTHQLYYRWPPCGDPGDKRLDELANDMVFASLPSDAHLIGPVVRTPAKYQQNTFESSGCDGPSVEMTFESDQPRSAIYQFYAAQATNAGWRAKNKGPYGYINLWIKPYSDSSDEANLFLSVLDNSPNGHAYKLVGNAPAVSIQ